MKGQGASTGRDEAVHRVDSETALPTNVVVITTSSSGKSRTFAGLEIKEWLFLGVSILNLLLVTVFTIWRLVEVIIKDHLSASPDFTFCILLLVNAVFCTFYVFHGVLKERQFEIYAFIGAVLVVLIYVVAEYVGNVQGRTLIKEVRLIAACILAPVNIGLAGWVAWHFGWLGFRIVGASEALQRMYRQACIFFSLVEFDLQASLSFVVLAMREGTDLDIGEIVTLSVGIPLCVIWMILGIMSVRRENRTGMWIFIFIGLLSPAYVIYKEVQLYRYIDADFNRFVNGDMNTIVYSTICAGCIALIVRGLLYIDTVFVFKNFGKGLKERAFESAISERTSLLSAADRRRR